MFRYSLIYLVILACIFTVNISVCDEGADYHRGLQLIQAGQLEESVLFFQKAIRVEPNNIELQREFNTLRQIIKLRLELPAEKNAVQWSIGAERLRRYYIKYHVVSEHLDLVLEIHRRVGTISRAIDVIDAFLMAEQYQEALDFTLSQKQPEQITPLQIEKARIYYQAGEKEHARKIVRSIPLEKLNSPESLFRLARVQSMTSQYASAVKSLKRCFELTPPNILPLIKKEAEKCSDFEPILSSSEFTEAMATRSVVPSLDMDCAKKWVGTSSFEERPQYSQNSIFNGEINFNDWRLH
jgi:tetratricopeptide (TPR) repeat protein